MVLYIESQVLAGVCVLEDSMLQAGWGGMCIPQMLGPQLPPFFLISKNIGKPGGLPVSPALNKRMDCEPVIL